MYALVSVVALAAVAQLAGSTSSTDTLTSPPPLEASQLRWAHIPVPRDYAENFPKKAMRRDIEGRAAILCPVLAEDRLGPCRPEMEEPGGEGFGEAAVRIGKIFRLRPGAAPEGSTVRIKIRFNLPKG
jgi:protein TonB